MNIGCWFEIEEKKDGFIIIIFFFFWVFDFVVLQSKIEFFFFFDTARASLPCIFNYGRKKKTKNECE